MKAYILTENDIELLKTTMEKWEAETRAKFSEGRSVSGTPEGDTLRKVRYALCNWMGQVTK